MDLLSERFLSAGLGDDRPAPGSVTLSGTAVEEGILGGIGTMGSYGLALWAMTRAPLAVVAALRETSILFGALLAATAERKVAGIRLVAAAGIAVGAVLLRLS